MNVTNIFRVLSFAGMLFPTVILHSLKWGKGDTLLLARFYFSVLVL